MRRPTTALLLAGVLALAGCSDAEPQEDDVESEFLHGAGGVNEKIDGILLRDVSVDEPEDGVYQAGDAARLRVVLYNESPEADTLVDVSSPAADDVRLLVDADCDGEPEELEEIPLPPVPPGEEPAGVSADGPEPYYAVYLLLDEQVRSGESLAVTFAFAEAGSTTVQVPVELSGMRNVEDDAACEPVL